MAKDKTPVTPAVRALRQAKIAFTPHLYKYEDHGGTKVAAQELGWDEHRVVKTLVMQGDKAKPLIVLMHGDCEVSTKSLARQIGAKSVEPCDPATAQKITGYQVGGISPFGTRQKVPVYVEKTILEMPSILINCGKRGFLAEVATKDLVKILNPTPVEVALS